jgi:hypothetical protein
MKSFFDVYYSHAMMTIHMLYSFDFEKHTKGIGSNFFLATLSDAYISGGLGKHGQGIANPIKIGIRLVRVGLGYVETTLLDVCTLVNSTIDLQEPKLTLPTLSTMDMQEPNLAASVDVCSFGKVFSRALDVGHVGIVVGSTLHSSFEENRH